MLTGRNRERGDEVLRSIREEGAEADFMPGDMRVFPMAEAERARKWIAAV